MDTISKITDSWFLLEPLLFKVFCTHTLIEDPELNIPFRTGKMRIEYNPQIVNNLPPKVAEDYLKFEIIRIILKHPYERQPLNADKTALKFASDITINDTKLFDYSDVRTKTARDFHLEQNLSYEEYYRRVKGILKNQTDSDAEENAELWEENQEAEENINYQIEDAVKNQMWGSLSSAIQTEIQASLTIKMDYRRIIQLFRSSVLTSRRVLTRMKPNRRYDFEYMGSRYAFVTRILVAIDVSGSIRREDIQNFLSVINRFFRYGIEQLDVIQFDNDILEIKNEENGKSSKILTLKKARKNILVSGGGGTDFQPAVDFFQKSNYDGMIIFTDGLAQPPEITKNAGHDAHILWIFTSRQEEENARSWLSTLPKHSKTSTYIP